MLKIGEKGFRFNLSKNEVNMGYIFVYIAVIFTDLAFHIQTTLMCSV